MTIPEYDICDCGKRGPHAVCNNTITGKTNELETLCRELLDAADKCSGPPYYIVQPFLGIVKRHAGVIKKLNLFG
jgi:hypothetical protein